MNSFEPTVRRQELGQELRMLRKKERISLREAAQVIDASESKLSRIETGHRNAPLDDIASLLGLYRADSKKRAHLLALAREAHEIGWLQASRPNFAQHQHTLIMLESKAEQIVNFGPLVVPGLLQTGDYTQAIMAESGVVPKDEIDDRMVTRLHRQSVLLRPSPPQLLALIDELVLHRTLGGPDVLRLQLRHLIKMASQPNITIRVIPNGHVGASSSFDLLRIADRPAVVFLESLTSNLFVERPVDVDVYERTLERLAACALDEEESIETIASAARTSKPERGAHEPHRQEHLDLEEE
jgi:DNA-binding XRE family transcriptional regulator